MTRLEKKEELIGLFSTGSIFIGDMLDEAMDFAEKNIEKEATRKIVECSEFLAKLPHWISVEDELPKINHNDSEWEFSDDVIVYLKDGDIAVGRYERDNSIGEHYWVLYGEDKDLIVTHWMPLPAPPRGSSGKPNNCKKGGEK